MPKCMGEEHQERKKRESEIEEAGEEFAREALSELLEDLKADKCAFMECEKTFEAQNMKWDAYALCQRRRARLQELIKRIEGGTG